jgi:hypothetical protein
MKHGIILTVMLNPTYYWEFRTSMLHMCKSLVGQGRQGISRFHFERVCLSLATRFYEFRICPSLFAGELEPCPEAEIIFGTHRACAMYASAQANFALKMADTIITSLVSAVPADGCEPIWNNSEAVKGSIVVVDRGTCPFADKVMRAQAMGAVAVVVVDYKSGAAAFAMPGNFSSVSIPATLITQEDGASLKDGLKHGATTLPIATLKIGPCAWITLAYTCKASKLHQRCMPFAHLGSVLMRLGGHGSDSVNGCRGPPAV